MGTKGLLYWLLYVEGESEGVRVEGKVDASSEREYLNVLDHSEQCGMVREDDSRS